MTIKACTYLFDQIDKKAFHLSYGQTGIEKEKFSDTLKRVVKVYGKPDSFLQAIANIWVRFINCIKYLFGSSDWQKAASLLRKEQKVKYEHFLDTEVMSLLSYLPSAGVDGSRVGALLEAVDEAHDAHVQVYTCNKKKITDLQLKILVESSRIQSESEEDFLDQYKSIIHKIFDEPIECLAKKVSMSVINKLPDNMNNRSKIMIFPQLSRSIKSALLANYDPLSI